MSEIERQKIIYAAFVWLNARNDAMKAVTPETFKALADAESQLARVTKTYVEAKDKS